MPSERKRFVIPVCLALLTIAVFARALGNDFVLWDDNRNIYHNPHLDTGTLAGIPEFWLRPYAGLYIPVTYTAWAVTARLSGTADSGELDAGIIPNPILFHALTIFIHIACVFLVFALIRRLLPKTDDVAAALGAALFAIHPLQVESVAWATGLKDVLSTFLGLLSVILYMSNHGSRWRYLGALACFALALLSKPSIAALPAILALLDVGLLKSPVRRTALRLAPFFAAGLAVVGFTMSIQYQPVLAFPPPEVTLWQRPIVALDAAAFYVSHILFPLHLGADYGRTPAVALQFKGILFAGILMTLLACQVFRFKPNRRFYIAAFGFALLAFAPVSGLVTFAFQGISTVADRYFYFPMAGIALAAAGWIAFSEHHWPRIAVAALIPVLALLSFTQAGHWKDTTALFTQALRVNPDSVIAHYNLGTIFTDNGGHDQAVAHYEKAIALNPAFPHAYNNLGRLLNDRGDFAAAEPLLEKAIELIPANPLPHCNLGFSLASRNRFAEAAAHYEKANRLTPGDPKIMTELAYALANAGRFDESVTWFRNAVSANPRLSPAYAGLGKVYLELRRPAEAVAALDKALEIARETPNYPGDDLKALTQARAEAASLPVISNQ